MNDNTNLQSFHDFVAGICAAISTPLPSPPPAEPLAVTSARPLAMLFSPHPDDEVLTGGLALRLWQEAAYQVVNVPMSYGSDPQHHGQRKREMLHACGLLGFGVAAILPENLTSIHFGKCEDHEWQKNIQVTADVLEQFRPDVIICPHARDDHPAHVGTYYLVTSALTRFPADYSPHVVFSESYASNTQANLLVGLSIDHVARLVQAMGAYCGALARHPYDKTLPIHFKSKIMYRPAIARALGIDISQFDFADPYQVNKREGSQLVPRPNRVIKCTEAPVL